MAYLISLLVFMSVAGLVFGIWLFLRGQRELIRLRLERIAAYYHTGLKQGAGPPPVPSSRKREAGPAIVRFLQMIRGGRARTLKGSVQRGPSGVRVPWQARLGAAAGVALVAALFSRPVGLGHSQAMVLAILGSAIGLLAPGAVMSYRNRARETAIRKALPDMLDLLTMSVEAGLGFDRALAKVIEGKKGPLAEEFEIVLQEIRVGRPRHEALRDLSERLKIPEISRLIGVIIQAEQLGVGIANTLRIQAGQLRLARRQRAEEMAMKAPIKMLFPLVFFIFPALFVALLGPAIIQVAAMFMKTGR